MLSTALDSRPFFERRVALRIERLGVRHAAGHPEHDDRVGGGFEILRSLGGEERRG